tara:strand:- start:8908 stop:10341 length:1434 start_codon:yes stop_codon:yes gene_type:complete
MATYNPIATGLEIGKGEAQVFDTSKLAGMAVGRQQMLAQKALNEKKKKEKELLDSIVELDTSKLWSRDLDMYTEKWNNYRQFVKDNYKELQNPSRNVGIHQQKKKLEQEMMQFVNSSAEAKKVSYELEKYLVNNADKVEDIEGLYEKFKKEAGNFDNPFSYITKKPETIDKIIQDNLANVMKAQDINYKVPDGKGGFTKQKGQSKEAFRNAFSVPYDDNPQTQESARRAWLAAGGANSGFNNPKDYFLDKAMQFYQKPMFEQQEGKESKGWSIGIGSGSFGDDAFFTGQYIGRKEDPITGQVTEKGDRVITMSKKGGKELPTQAMNLQLKDGSEITKDYAIQDIVEVDRGGENRAPKYELRVRVPIKDEKNLDENIKISEANLKLLKEKLTKFENDRVVYKREEKIKTQKEKIQKEEETLAKLKKGFELINVPLTNKINIGELEKVLQVQDLYNQLPNLFLPEEEGTQTTNPLKINL